MAALVAKPRVNRMSVQQVIERRAELLNDVAMSECALRELDAQAKLTVDQRLALNEIERLNYLVGDSAA